MSTKYTKEYLEPIVKNSGNWGDVARTVGVSMHGGFRDWLKQKCIRMEINFDHFIKVGHAWNKGIPNKSATKSAKEILIVYPKHSDGPHTHQLRRAMIESGIRHQCYKCNNNGEWLGKKLTLQIDHIDGNSLDCRKQNLRFACPNCHSQTSTYKVKNFRRDRAVVAQCS